MHKLRVGVLMGGKSLENEVSLNSGRTICDHLDSARYRVIPLFQTAEDRLFILPQRFLHRGKISDFLARLETETEEVCWDTLKEHVDFIFIAQHGRFGEDGCLQGVLEILGIPYFGSKIFASALGMNKRMHKEMLRAVGIAVPAGFSLSPHEIKTLSQEELAEKLITHNLTYPLVVKPEQEGSSFGVSIVKTVEELQQALSQAAHIFAGKPQHALVEEYVTGLEFSCIVITDYATGRLIPLTPTEIVSEKGYFDYEQKYMPGRALKRTPAQCAPEYLQAIKDACVRVMQTLGMHNLARIDGFLAPDGSIVITDPNSFAGMAPSSFTFLQAAQQGMSHTQLINHLIETELQAYGMLDQLLLQEHQEKTMRENEKIRVAVLLGGRSNEKEISLESGRNITYKLSPHKYEAFPIFVSSELKLYSIPQHILVFNSTHEIEQALTKDMQILWHDLPKLVDFVFIGLHGGEGENGAVQGMLEMLGLPYNGSGVLTSSLCMDKYKTNSFLQTQGFDVPQGILYTRAEWEHNNIPQFNLPFPVIIKPHDDGCSVLVSKAHNQEELTEILKEYFTSTKSAALIEECISGMELTVGVIGNDTPQALPPSQAVATAGILSIEEKFLPGAGENQTPAPLAHDALELVKATMENVYKAVQASGYVRIDCFYQSAQQSPTKKERVIILEINTLPGMTPATCIFHQAAELGIKPMDFIDKIIDYGFEKHTSSAKIQQNTKPLTV